MPRSSKHKSSKHSSRDYSDSERDSIVKDRRSSKEEGGGGVKASKDSGSGEKRRLDSKDAAAAAHGNGEYSDEYASSSKRRRDGGGGGGDRWNGGEEGSKKSKTVGDSKSRRRDEGVVEGEEVKRSGSGKHRDSSSSGRREGVAEKEKERKLKDGRSEESVEIDDQDQRLSKQVFENNDSKKIDELRSPELDNQLERRMRKKRDDYGDGDKHQDDVGDGYDRRLSSRDDIAKDGKKKDDRRKDEKYRDKYREEMDRENKHRHDKQRDERPAKDHTSIRSDDKHTREEKNSLESRQKRTKHPEGDRDHYHDRDGERDRDRDSESVRDRERHNERDHDYDHDRDHDYDRERDWDWEHDRDRDRDRHRDRDGSHVDDRSARGKESGTKKKTFDDRDDYSDSKSRAVKSYYPDAEKRTLSSNRADSDVDRGRSQSRHAHADSTGTSNKHRSSPASNTHIGKDEHRNANAEDSKYRDSTVEQRTKSSREGYSGISDRGPKYKSMDKPIKIDECPAGDLSTERSSSAKASPMGLIERSPSSTSIERRYVNKSGVKRNLEIDESGRRSSNDGRDFSTSDDRHGRELTLEKLDEPPQADSSFYSRTNQSNPPVIPTPPGFRTALDRPFTGSMEDDVRDNSNTRYRRSSEHGFGRMHGGNSWRAVPNWTSPVPNGFVPFPPGPGHGGFQAMMPQFASQPLFGIRAPMEVNHAGIPYHIADADRFPGHLRPLGWPNMMDGTGPAHLHGWDNSNGVFRDDTQMYGGSDWDRNRHSTNSHGWESGSETWKEQNSDSKKDLPSPACKDESVPAVVDNGLTDQTIRMSQDEHNRDEFHDKSPETKLTSVNSPEKVPLNSSPTAALEKVPDTSTPSDNTTLLSRFYLSKLDISVDLVLPELYDQCMYTLNIGKPVDAVASTELLLKNGSSARQKFAASSSKRPFPAIDNSIFQRAIGIYKKQRVKLPNGGDVDVIAVSNQVQVNESVPVPGLENRQISVSASDGTKDVLMPTLEPNKVEVLSPAKEHLEEINQTSSPMEQDHDCTHSLKTGMYSPSSGAENQEAGLGAPENDVTSDKVNSGDAEEIHSTASKDEAELPPMASKDEAELPPMASKDEAELPPTTSKDEAELPPTASKDEAELPPTASKDEAELPPTASKDEAELPPTASKDEAELPPTASKDEAELPPTAFKDEAELPPTASKDEAELPPRLQEESDDMNTKATPTDSAQCADGKLGFGDTKVNPLIFEDGSSKACDALMHGSNESESLILSRIHHSPESTH